VIRPFVLLLSLLLATGSHAQWRAVAPGVDYQRIVRGKLDVHVTRIDLAHPNTKVIATQESEQGLTVSDYAKRTHAIAAINGDYFDPRLRPIGKSAGACGLWWKGQNVQRNQGLVAVGRGRAEIQRNTQKTRSWMRGAISGWPMLVEGCSVLRELPGSDSFTHAPHPRTAVGLSKNGKTMYFVVADGRRANAPGLTLPELAEFFVKELGACAAMNLDGGGSSAMWLGSAIVNTPSDGSERKVGNHLAVLDAANYTGCERKGK
jgi:exopolysaccharide biosynthesis protein